MVGSEMELFKLSRFSIRRKSTQINLSILLIIALGILGIIATGNSFNSVRDAAMSDFGSLRQSGETAASSPENPGSRTAQAISTGRTQLLIIGATALALTVFVAYRLITVGLRAVALEVWIRRMGQGDLDYKVEMKGRDEIVELSVSLEELRRRSIRAQQLDLVQQLSQELREKNDELERVLAELRRTQDQVIMRQKLSELGELTAGVAHEIRNPLNFVKNFSEASVELMDELRETLTVDADGAANEQQQLVTEIVQELTENMGRIHSHVDRANHIVNDMLALGREGGDFQPVNINALLRERAHRAYNSTRGLYPEFRMEIIEELAPDAGELRAVPDDLGRVFLNLVSNACYATEEKRQANEDAGKPFMPTLWLKTERDEAAIQIRVRDNGPGIAPDVMEKIFSPFFTTKPTDKGTGLGLSLSADIIRKHGGSITPFSEPGEYTEMLISLPVSNPAESE